MSFDEIQEAYAALIWHEEMKEEAEKSAKK